MNTDGRDPLTVWPWVSFILDDALGIHELSEFPTPASVMGQKFRFIGWQCGFEPLYVAVMSYLPNTRVDLEYAVEIAIDYLQERKWFVDNDNPTEPDYAF